MNSRENNITSIGVAGLSVRAVVLGWMKLISYGPINALLTRNPFGSTSIANNTRLLSVEY